MTQLLSWEKLKHLKPTAQHNEEHQSDTGIAGTYVPNMSEEDKVKWKAKAIGGEDPRVEIRKTLKDKGYAQILLIVRAHSKHPTITMSANNKMHFSEKEWGELMKAVDEAMIKLRFGLPE